MQEIISTQVNLYAEQIINKYKGLDPYHRIEKFIDKLYENLDPDMFKYNWLCQNGLIYDMSYNGENNVCYGKYITQLYVDINIYLKDLVDTFFAKPIQFNNIQELFNGYMNFYNIEILASLHIYNPDLVDIETEPNLIISCIEFEKDEHYYFVPVTSQKFQQLIKMFRNFGVNINEDVVELTHFADPKYNKEYFNNDINIMETYS
jgi:hypothetical protein